LQSESVGTHWIEGVDAFSSDRFAPRKMLPQPRYPGFQYVLLDVLSLLEGFFQFQEVDWSGIGQG
jgi:hypothetical protein